MDPRLQKKTHSGVETTDINNNSLPPSPQSSMNEPAGSPVYVTSLTPGIVTEPAFEGSIKTSNTPDTGGELAVDDVGKDVFGQKSVGQWKKLPLLKQKNSQCSEQTLYSLLEDLNDAVDPITAFVEEMLELSRDIRQQPGRVSKHINQYFDPIQTIVQNPMIVEMQGRYMNTNKNNDPNQQLNDKFAREVGSNNKLHSTKTPLPCPDVTNDLQRIAGCGDTVGNRESNDHEADLLKFKDMTEKVLSEIEMRYSEDRFKLNSIKEQLAKFVEAGIDKSSIAGGLVSIGPQLDEQNDNTIGDICGRKNKLAEHANPINSKRQHIEH
ncbi:unnamed protein product [Orchesella dallaii]|uniref:Uncharacterized protein n=1 Tax=Orchesella dallaii TaxID=48710 RepID=A0ABP1PTW9_9HEXA